MRNENKYYIYCEDCGFVKKERLEFNRYVCSECNSLEINGPTTFYLNKSESHLTNFDFRLKNLDKEIIDNEFFKKDVNKCFYYHKILRPSSLYNEKIKNFFKEIETPNFSELPYYKFEINNKKYFILKKSNWILFPTSLLNNPFLEEIRIYFNDLNINYINVCGYGAVMYLTFSYSDKYIFNKKVNKSILTCFLLYLLEKGNGMEIFGVSLFHFEEKKLLCLRCWID